jgi:hypothetical protein
MMQSLFAGLHTPAHTQHAQYLALAQEAQKLTKPELTFKIVNLIKFSVYSSKAIANFSPSSQIYEVTPNLGEEGPLTAFIVHSSSSTEFPKPITISH